MEMVVPQIILEEEPPMASASEVFGSTLENVAGSEACTGFPFSSTKSRRRRLGVEPNMSECISPRRELFRPEVPGAADRDDRTKSPLELVGTSCCLASFCRGVLPGLELEA